MMRLEEAEARTCGELNFILSLMGNCWGSKEGSHLIICIFLKGHSVVWRIYCAKEKEYASGHFRWLVQRSR